MEQSQILSFIQDLLDHSSIEYQDIQVLRDDELDIDMVAVTVSSRVRFPVRMHSLLQSLNQIVRSMIESKLPEGSEPISVLVDINDIQGRRLRELKAKARIVADRARSFKTDVDMEPMSSYERRIVHAVLSSQSDIDTKSEGQGRERKVIVKYTGQ